MIIVPEANSLTMRLVAFRVVIDALQLELLPSGYWDKLKIVDGKGVFYVQNRSVTAIDQTIMIGQMARVLINE